MSQEFWTEQFRRDRALQLQWISLLEEQSDSLTAEITAVFSRILNSHHIWNTRLRQSTPESELNDVLPVSHWKQLQEANSRETVACLDDFSAEAKVLYHDSEGVRLERLSTEILFQLLQDNAFYRGQLDLLCHKAGLRTPDGLLVSL
jgi:hypothetical protein